MSPRPASARRMPVAALLCCALLTAPGPTARAFASDRPANPVTTVPPYVTDTARADRVAEGLRESPLFVDPEAASSLNAEERAGLRDRLAGADVPVRIAVLPFSLDDASGGDPEVFLHALHDALGEEGVYVALEAHRESRGYVHAVAFDVPIDLELSDELSYSGREGASDAELLAATLDEVDAAPAGPAGSPAPHVPLPDTDTGDSGSPAQDYLYGGFIPGLLIVGPLLALLVWGLGTLVLRAARRSPLLSAAAVRTPGAGAGSSGPAEAARPRQAPRRPSRGHLVRTLNTELQALSEEIAEAGEEHPHRRRAVNAFDAAGILAREHRDQLDLVGAIVLARDGRQALSRERGRRTRPACMVNPLHGSAPDTGRKTDVPGMGRVRVCADCARLPAETLRRRILLVGHEGRRVAHHETARFWITVEYGEHTRDLPERVMEELGVH
ncbi:hypothetical protein HDA32_004853 [Spinactinospora alkalitolerans]|uniref:TPM domain-containing protein n=1 Tax=Spinactinospora alkalitolerans TaxID=687207 RepID=A0A852U4A0_9ACTN|nr:hypothetical protein [Spinactinospora alkalitolerans]NYE49733.1 hypothetical protein [Spinactinospora alkalitolerans]